MADFGSAPPIMRAAGQAFRPPKRISVSQGAADTLRIHQPGGYSGPWSPTEAPYMVEPMDMLASRRHEAVCFVGPSRTGKTMGLLDGWLSHAACHDPGDMLILQMTQEKAREYSKTRIDRALRHSPDLRALISASGHDDNTYDKLFRHGMWLKIGWPSGSQLSGSDYRYVALTDYDRMPDNIDGEADAFGLGLTRTRTFLSRGMCLVESSPGREIKDPNWKPVTPHEAPPATGIIGIYNRGDRRRLYWSCPCCGEYFQASPGLDLFRLPKEDDLLEIVRTEDLGKFAERYARVVCPICEAEIPAKFKAQMNAAGIWLRDGETIDRDGVRGGDPLTSSIASYWLGGVAAAYQSWSSLIRTHLQALREYALTGSELPLQKTANTDQGMPYLPRIVRVNSTQAHPSDRVDQDLERYIVPQDARFLVASVDVQGGQRARFEVQVFAVGPHLEQWVVDRFALSKSCRPGIGEDLAPIDPGSYAEDWDRITEKVLNSTYRLADGREMRVRLAVVDTGGEPGVTDKAYDWYRRLRRVALHGRVMLIKGGSSKDAPLIRETMAGAKHEGMKGDVPLYLLNTNLMKDAVHAMMMRATPGPGYLHIPAWLPKSWFDEFNAEVRHADGTWHKIRARNEALDLTCYIRAGILRMGADRIDWSAPPIWAASPDENPEVITRDQRRVMQQRPAPSPSFPGRRVAASPYLR